MSPGLGRKISGAAFVLSVAGTAFLLVVLASVGPFAQQPSPGLGWSIVLWGMVGIVTFVLMMRLVMLALTALAGMVWAAKNGAVATVHLLKVFVGR
jgi:hypothetical protein